MDMKLHDIVDDFHAEKVTEYGWPKSPSPVLERVLKMGLWAVHGGVSPPGHFQNTLLAAVLSRRLNKGGDNRVQFALERRALRLK